MLLCWFTMKCNGVLMTTCISYGNTRFTKPHRIQIPLPVNMKISMIDNVGEISECAKFNLNLSRGVSRHIS
jgi:hypothetical protein